MRFTPLLVAVLLAFSPTNIADAQGFGIGGDSGVGGWTSGSSQSSGGGGLGGSSQPSGGGGPGGSSQPSGGGGPLRSVGLENPLGTTDLMALLMRILAFVIRIGSIVVVFMLVYVGYLFATGAANPDRIKQAKEGLMVTIIGALILLGSQAIALGIQATVKALSVGQ